MTAANTIERDRITARVPKHIKNDLEQAANLLGTGLSDFMVQAALSKAREVLDREAVIEISKEDAEIIFNAIENPDKPNAQLRKALARAQEIGTI